MRVFLRQLARHLMPVLLFLRSLDNSLSRSIGKENGISAAPFLHPPHLAEFLQFFACIIRLHRLRLNDDAGVIPLDVPAFGRHRPRDVAGCGCYRHNADD